ncbi:MAG: hypothetical protein HY320_14605 [Armatimonadetes bacterium]|nr:hypothetical protein [Armatimonadota bacterium]
MTLLELLVAMSLAALMLIATAGAFQAAARTRARLRERTPRLAALRAAFHIMQRDLRSITYAPSPADYPVFADANAVASQYPQQILQFASAASDPLLAGRPSPGVSFLQYEIASDPRTGRPGLWRHETPYPVPPPESTSASDRRSALLLPDAVSLQVQFFDPSTGEWMPTWEATDHLPSAVWVNVGVLDPDEIETAAEATPRIHSLIASVAVSGYQPEPVETAANAPEGGSP